MIENRVLITGASGYVGTRLANLLLEETEVSGGFKISKPNASRTCGCGTSFSV